MLERPVTSLASRDARARPVMPWGPGAAWATPCAEDFARAAAVIGVLRALPAGGCRSIRARPSNAGSGTMGEATGTLYAIVGLVMSLGGGALALTRGRGARSFYAADVYHMTARSHRRFALLSGAFAAGFLAALRWPVLDIPLLAVYTLFFILYVSSFARGFTGEDD